MASPVSRVGNPLDLRALADWVVDDPISEKHVYGHIGEFLGVSSSVHIISAILPKRCQVIERPPSFALRAPVPENQLTLRGQFVRGCLFALVQLDKERGAQKLYASIRCASEAEDVETLSLLFQAPKIQNIQRAFSSNRSYKILSTLIKFGTFQEVKRAVLSKKLSQLQTVETSHLFRDLMERRQDHLQIVQLLHFSDLLSPLTQYERYTQLFFEKAGGIDGLLQFLIEKGYFSSSQVAISIKQISSPQVYQRSILAILEVGSVSQLQHEFVFAVVIPLNKLTLPRELAMELLLKGKELCDESAAYQSSISSLLEIMERHGNFAELQRQDRTLLKRLTRGPRGCILS